MSREAEKLRTGRSLPEPVPDSGLRLRGSQVGEQCPDDFLTPREMVGFLRASEEGSLIPEDVVEHLKACSICEQNWEFIATTDPALREFREKRVEMIIQTVIQDENSGLQPVPPEQRERLVGELEQDLSRTRSNFLTEDTGLQIALTKPEGPSVDQMLERIARVQEIENDKSRYEFANELAAAFAKRVEFDAERGTIKVDFLNKLMGEELGTIDLSAKDRGVSPEAAVAFVVSLPHTSYFRPPLLEKTESGILFDLGRFKSLRPEFKALAKKFDDLTRPTTAAVI